MKKILITHAFGPQNRGDHELLLQLINILNFKYGDAASIVVFSSYPVESERYFNGVEFHKSPFYRPKGRLEAAIMIWDFIFWVLSSYVSFFSIFLSPKRKRKFEVVMRQDLILMCPGGYMYSNGLSFYVNVVNGLIFRKSSALKVASPMSIGPFFSRKDYFFAKFFFSIMDRVHVRESYSQQVAKKMGLDPIFTHDLAWWEGFEDNIYIKDFAWEGSYVATVIDWNYPEVGSFKEYRERYIREYLVAADILCGESGRPLILYNQVGSGDGASRDEILIKEIVERSCGRIIFDATACTPLTLKSRMKSCKGVLASRFHSALFAMQVETPFIAISYQPKAEYILSDLGLELNFRRINDFSGAEVANSLIGLKDKQSEFLSQLRAAKKEAVKNIRDSFFVSI